MEQSNSNRTARAAVIGTALFIISLLLPLVVNVETFNIIILIIQSLETLSVGPLVDACIRLVLMNTFRIAPAYLGALIIADIMARESVHSSRSESKRRFGSPAIINFVVPTLLVPLIYMVIEAIYNIRYDFRMPAILSIATVVATLRISRTETTESLGKASLIVIQLVFGFQWLDIVPALTGLGFGHGEMSQDIKVVADVLGATSLFNIFGLVASGILIVNGLISAKFIVDYQERLKFAELERQRSIDMERMKAEAVLARGYREMQTLVHDLKTPLTTIQGLASAIAEFDDVTGMSVHARRISGAAERMDAMIQEMMSESARRRIPADDFAKRLAAHLPEEKTHGLVTFETEDDLPDVLINQTRMVRAVVNLVDNSLDSGAKKVNVQFSTEGDMLNIAVSDDGSGMSETALAKCLEGGYSTKNSTGLGLMFVKQVVEEHQGTLFIQSAPGGGTLCVMSIPCFAGGECHEENPCHR